MANRNTEAHFSQIPQANIRRARFKRDYSNITTINEGDLVPIYVDEVLPGDTISLTQNGLIRMATPIYPVMDNCYMDTYYFFVPNRLLWEHWENFMGQNDDSYWAPKTEYSIPQTETPSGGWNAGTIADYMGIPIKVPGLVVNSLPFRAYARIWNEWFRDENLQQPVVQDTDDASNVGSNTGNQLTDAQNGGLPLKAAKFHDYFTSCLPEPQKGEAVSISVGGVAPVKLYGDTFGNTLYKGSGAGADDVSVYMSKRGGTSSQVGWLDNPTRYWDDATSSEQPEYLASSKGYTYDGTSKDFYLGTDLSGASAIDINSLRQAIAIQHILEADARGGTRYTEILKNQFGVTSPDSRLQRSEYLGGSRITINMNQVIQNSATDSTSPQGNTAAYSMTTQREKMVSYSAVEHGYIIGLAVIRVDHSYQQGLSRMWTRKRRFDFYHPMLANLGEMEVLNQEIYAQGNDEDTEIFGFQEAWADYRYHPSIVTGEMRSTYDQPLDAWHYADYYESLPTLSSSWIQEGEENINRTLAVQSEISHQFICNFYFDQTWTRPMPGTL